MCLRFLCCNLAARIFFGVSPLMMDQGFLYLPIRPTVDFVWSYRPTDISHVFWCFEHGALMVIIDWGMGSLWSFMGCCLTPYRAVLHFSDVKRMADGGQPAALCGLRFM